MQTSGKGAVVLTAAGLLDVQVHSIELGAAEWPVCAVAPQVGVPDCVGGAAWAVKRSARCRESRARLRAENGCLCDAVSAKQAGLFVDHWRCD